MKIEEDDVIFSSGRREYANNGIIGLSPELRVFEGYDGGISDDLTADERRELSKFMIKQWRAYGAAV